MRAKKTGKFRSKLESFCAEQLTLNKLPFEYEKVKYVITPSFKYEGVSLERIGKSFIQQRQGQAAITYTPDFTGTGWLIECKGHFTTTARLKWKLFKKYLAENSIKLDLYMPTTQKEVMYVIGEIIRKNNE
jgi:hypothetical protein